MSKINVIGKVLLASDKQLERVQKIFLMEEALLNDGATKVMADPAFEAGAAVFVITEDEQQIPVPVSGESEAYELEDGRQFTVAEEGVIAEVMEAGQEEEPVSEEGEEPVAANDEPTEQPLPKVVIESVVKEMKFSSQEEAEEEYSKLEAKLAELSKGDEEEGADEEGKEKEVELSEETELKTITYNPEQEPASTKVQFQWGSKREATAKDRVMRALANRK